MPFRERHVTVTEALLRRVLGVLEGVGSVSVGLWPELYAIKLEVAQLIDIVPLRRYWCEPCRTWFRPAKGETTPIDRCILCGGSTSEVVSIEG